MNKYLFTLVVILSITLYNTLERNNSLRAESHRLKYNLQCNDDSLIRYKTKSGQLATSVNVLRLKCNELESNLAKQIDVVNQLKIKLKHVEQLSTTIHQTKFNATTVIKRDTIICKDTIYRFHWHNTWNQLSGVIFGDSLTCTLSVRDTLHQIVHRIPRRFLFIRFGTKYLKQEIVTSNPNCNIVWSKYIKVEKSRCKNICLP